MINSSDEIEGNARNSKVYEIIQKTIASGALGSLKVQPSFLRVNQLTGRQPAFRWATTVRFRNSVISSRLYKLS